MATLDLGKIKLVWRGTYNNGTAYTVDDVVEYTDGGILSSYVCVANSTGNAPSSSGTAHASWNYMTKGAVTGGFTSHQVFSTSGSHTWTKPTGINKVKVTVTGGGGGGGGGSPNFNAKGGGGGGGTAIEVIDVSSVSSVSVTVGAGGQGGSASGGGTGGDGVGGGASSFGSYCSATGGYGGTDQIDPRVRTPGTATGGDINILGGDGDIFEGGNSQADEGGSTHGGASFWGGGGAGDSGEGVDVGASGQAYGSGGGGGQHTTSNGASAGGAGAVGIVYVEEFK